MATLNVICARDDETALYALAGGGPHDFGTVWQRPWLVFLDYGGVLRLLPEDAAAFLAKNPGLPFVLTIDNDSVLACDGAKIATCSATEDGPIARIGADGEPNERDLKEARKFREVEKAALAAMAERGRR